jgi:hypothetical protein
MTGADAPLAGASPFDARFLEHPAFSVFDAAVRERLALLGHFPAPSEFRALVSGIPNAAPLGFEFELEDGAAVREAGGFDSFIARTSRIPTRAASFHDLFGALIWLHFPLLKTALHRAHLEARAEVRGPRQNAATHCDESGVLIVSAEPAVFDAIAELNWPEVFWQRRAALARTTRFLCFGHGLLDALRVPHPKQMGMALFVRVSDATLALAAPALRVFLDRELSERLPGFLLEPARLAPLPVLGVPGWSPAQSPEFYEDSAYFRRARQRPRAFAVEFIELG